MHSRKREFFVMLDIGGTSIKAALLDKDCKVVANSFSITTIDSNGMSEQVINNIISIVKETYCTAAKIGNISGIGICFPEFSDYQKGTIAVIKEKFRNSAGISLRDEIIKRLGLFSTFPFVFEEDSIAFLKGASRNSKAKTFNRIIGITLGTGLGSAYMEHGKIVRNAPGVPLNGELGYLPFKKGIIEDIISSRGLLSIYVRYSGNLENNAMEIALRAKKGDASAIRAFEKFGRVMGQILKQYIEDFGAECIILGGQIAKSYELFAMPLKNELTGIASLKKIIQPDDIDFCPFYGLFTMFDR